MMVDQPQTVMDPGDRGQASVVMKAPLPLFGQSVASNLHSRRPAATWTRMVNDAAKYFMGK